MSINRLLILVCLLFSGILKSQISTTCVPSVSIVTSAVNGSICIGQSASYTVSGGTSYTFVTNPSTSPAFTGTSGVVTPTTHTSYQVIGTNQFGCTSAAQQIIFVNQLPQISIIASPTMVCFGLTSTLTANAAASNTAHVYSWAQGGNSSNSVVTPSVNTTYTVTATNTITSCQNTQTRSVAVFNPTFYVTPDTGVCRGNSIILRASGANTFTWAGGTSPSNGSGYIVSPTVATVYTVGATTWTVNSALKCNSTNTILVVIYPQPTVTAFASRTLSFPNYVTKLWAVGANNYYWPDINQSGDTVWIFPMKQSYYKVIGQDLFGCRDTAKVLVRWINVAGIIESKKNLFHVFPNPSADSFDIDAAEPCKVTLHNFAGQLVKEIIINSTGVHTIITRDLPPGTYMLRGESDEKIFQEKIIIHR